jgi:predicted DNA-binding antitoxin AbrB/MazE fold protein
MVTMIKTLKVVFDGSVFRPSGPVHLEAGKKYTITVKSLPEDPDVEQDPAFDISSLAVATGIPDLATEHDHYLYGLPKWGVHEK